MSAPLSFIGRYCPSHLYSTQTQIDHFTFAQTAPFSDLPVAERRGRIDKKRRRVETEQEAEMGKMAEEVLDMLLPPR